MCAGQNSHSNGALVWPKRPGDLLFRRVPDGLPIHVRNSVRRWRIFGCTYSLMLLVVAIGLMTYFYQMAFGAAITLPLPGRFAKLLPGILLLLGLAEWLLVYVMRRKVRKLARLASDFDNMLCLGCGYCLLGGLPRISIQGSA